MENLEPPDLGFTNMEPLQGFSNDLDCHQSEPLSQHSSIIMPGFLSTHRPHPGLGLGDPSEFTMNDSLDLHDFAITSSGIGLANHLGMGPLPGELSMFGLSGGSSVGFPGPPHVPGHGDLTMPQSMATGGRMPVYSFLPRSSLPSLISSEPCSSVSLAPPPPPSFSFHGFPVPGGFGDGFSMPVTCPPAALSFRGLPNIETMMIGSDPGRACFSASGHLSNCHPSQVVPISSFVPPMPKYIPPHSLPAPVVSSSNMGPKTPGVSMTPHKKDLCEKAMVETSEGKVEKNSAQVVTRNAACVTSSPEVSMISGNPRPNVISSDAQVSSGLNVIHRTSPCLAPNASVQNATSQLDSDKYQPGSSSDGMVSMGILEGGMRVKQEAEDISLSHGRMSDTRFLPPADPPCPGENLLTNDKEKSKGDGKSEEFLTVECESITNSDTEELDSALSRNLISPRDGKGEPSLSSSILATLKMEDRLQLESAGFLSYDLGEGDLSQTGPGFVEKADLNVHIEESQCVIVDGHKRWRCLQCPKMYSTKHNLVTHILGHRGIKPHYCTICGKFFKQISHLQTHLLTHGKVKPHVCTVCNRNFTQTSHVKRHMAIHMERRPHICEHCNRGFAYPNELKNHLDKHKANMEHTCEDCGATFDVVEKLRKHKSAEHRDAAALVCKVCGKAYTYPSQLRDHVMKHEGTRPYICGECGMDFMKEHHLKAHVFTHTGLKPYACRLCDKAFNQKANLQRHMLVHNGEKKYACEMCGRGFTQHQVLRAHLVTHQDTKPFQCKVCGKGFSRLHNLNGHMHMHDGEKPFVCCCGASFTLKGNLNRHRKDKQCQPTESKDSSSSLKDEEAAKILNEMSSKKSKADHDADGSPTPKKKRKSVPRKTMSQDAVNDVDEEVAAAWQLMKDSILQEEEDDDEDDDEEEEEEDMEEMEQKPNYAELMAMFPEHAAEMEDENIANASANSQSMFQCLDAGDPAFQFPVDSRAVEVTTFLSPSATYSSPNLTQAGTPNASTHSADQSGLSAGLASKFHAKTTSSVKGKGGVPVTEVKDEHKVTTPLDKALGSESLCAVPVVHSIEVEELIKSTFAQGLASRSSTEQHQNERASRSSNEISNQSSDDLAKGASSEGNTDDDGFSPDDQQMLLSYPNLQRPKVARLGKKASLAALFATKLTPEQEQT